MTWSTKFNFNYIVNRHTQIVGYYFLFAPSDNFLSLNHQNEKWNEIFIYYFFFLVVLFQSSFKHAKNVGCSLSFAKYKNYEYLLWKMFPFWRLRTSSLENLIVSMLVKNLETDVITNERMNFDECSGLWIWILNSFALLCFWYWVSIHYHKDQKSVGNVMIVNWGWELKRLKAKKK